MHKDGLCLTLIMPAKLRGYVPRLLGGRPGDMSHGSEQGNFARNLSACLMRAEQQSATRRSDCCKNINSSHSCATITIAISQTTSDSRLDVKLKAIQRASRNKGKYAAETSAATEHADPEPARTQRRPY